MSLITNRISRFFDGITRLHEFEKPDDIATFLQGLGYTGKCSVGQECVVSNFLRDCVGDPDANISTSMWDVVYRWPSTYSIRKGMVYDVFQMGVKADALGAFVANFDLKEYPELVAKEPVTA